MLALAHRRETAELAARRKERDLGIAETERREPRELRAQVERQARAARHDRVDARHRPEILLDEQPGRMLGERAREASTFSGLIERPAAAR